MIGSRWPLRERVGEFSSAVWDTIGCPAPGRETLHPCVHEQHQLDSVGKEEEEEKERIEIRLTKGCIQEAKRMRYKYIDFVQETNEEFEKINKHPKPISLWLRAFANETGRWQKELRSC